MPFGRHRTNAERVARAVSVPPAHRAGASILNKLRNNQAGYFITMLGIMVVSGVLADFINLPDIVGAFLAGWAVNTAATGHPAKEKLVFFGKALFIPIFFIVTGLLIRKPGDKFQFLWRPDLTRPADAPLDQHLPVLIVGR